MSYIDRTQQYRHGVLVGNYVEDTFGVEIVRRGVDSVTGPMGLPPSEQFRSIAHASYRRPTQEDLRSASESKLESVDRRQGVGKALLSQPNVNPQDQFVTSYSALGSGQPGALKPDYTLSRLVNSKSRSKPGDENPDSRRIQNFTDYSYNFTKVLWTILLCLDTLP